MLKRYKSYYTATHFWDKIKTIAKFIGNRGLCLALALYYILQKDSVPYTDKAMIIGALGYFVLPIDMLPDITPILGYSDDIGILYMVVQKCKKHMGEDIVLAVHRKVNSYYVISYEEVKKILS